MFLTSRIRKCSCSETHNFGRLAHGLLQSISFWKARAAFPKIFAASRMSFKKNCRLAQRFQNFRTLARAALSKHFVHTLARATHGKIFNFFCSRGHVAQPRSNLVLLAHANADGKSRRWKIISCSRKVLALAVVAHPRADRIICARARARRRGHTVYICTSFPSQLVFLHASPRARFA